MSTSKTGGYEYKSGTSMAAPHATGVAALMAAVRPDASAAELRAMMLQAATRTSLPVGAGYLDAARSVVQAMNSSSYDESQRPTVRVLLATRNRRGIVAQVAALGNVQAIRRFKVTLGGRTVAGVKRRGSPFTIRIRSRRGGTLKVEGLDRRGAVLASATKQVMAVRKRKGNPKRGGHVGGSVRIG